jgi:hypothetical protein
MGSEKWAPQHRRDGRGERRGAICSKAACAPREEEGMGDSTSMATDPAEVAAYFDRLATEPKDTQIRGLSGICHFDIESVGSWLVIINDGHMEARQGGGPADSVVGCTADAFLSVVRDGRNGFTAAMRGRLRVSGNLALILLLRRIDM